MIRTERPTIPAPKPSYTFQEYCEFFGVNVGEARAANVVEAIYKLLSGKQ